MKMKSISNPLRLFLALTCWSVSTLTLACTGMQVKAKDGTYVNGRTVEFATPIDLTAVVIPRNYSFSTTLPDNKPGFQYKSKYAVVGATTFGEPAVMDGMNEKGLTAAAFYFPGYAEYTTVTPQNKNKGVSPTEFVNWILTQFASIDEVKKNIDKVIIVPTSPKGWGLIPPFHYVVYDKSGASIVIEPIKGALVINDNKLGVITNSPNFTWHMTNLANYINLSPVSVPDKSIDGVTLTTFGQGSGLHGLPGDFTPPSRFVRAAVFSSNAIPAKDSSAEVLQIFHLLNQFDIPAGSVRSDENGKTYFDTTLATTVKDPKNLNYYFRTYDDQNVKMISLGSFDLNSKDLMKIDVSNIQAIQDVSSNAQVDMQTKG